MFSADVLVSIVLPAFLTAAMLAVLVLSILNVRTPSTGAMIAASGVVAVALIAVIVVPPYGVPTLVSGPIVALGIAAATIGGNPFARRALDIAAGDRVRETADGGILIVADEKDDAANVRTLMRGGTVIGYLERVAAVVAITVGFPEAVAAVIAVKGIGRFPELAEPEARERFIIGTLASLLWAGAIGVIIRLSLG